MNRGPGAPAGIYLRGHTSTALKSRPRLRGWLGREQTSSPSSIGASATALRGLRADVDGCRCASRIDISILFLMLA